MNDYIPIRFTNTEQYLELLDLLEGKTVYIGLVPIVSWTDDPVVERALEVMPLIEKKEVSKWPGTTCIGHSQTQFLFHANTDFFAYLRQFPSFFFNSEEEDELDEDGEEIVIETEFGWTDIAFYDAEWNVLFSTTTHEGYADAHTSVYE